MLKHLHKADLLAGLQGARSPLSDQHHCLRAAAGPLEDQEAGDGQPAPARHERGVQRLVFRVPKAADVQTAQNQFAGSRQAQSAAMHCSGP